MVDFAAHAAVLSAEADNRLGDLIQYAIDGANGGDYVAMKARLDVSEPTAGWDKSDEIKGTWRLRIARGKVAQPSINDRVQCAAIFGTDVYRPMATDPLRDGRYWLVDLQKV